MSMAEDPEQWQLVRGAPELYERYLVPAVTSPWAVDSSIGSALDRVRECWISPAGPAWSRASLPGASRRRE
ncbi:MAG TPA: hypothetical protein VLP43_03460 [Solirubrobacteraceae bacterium]|nr:hypothetical protein [Solirubrobacteraceae bacterium]